MLEGMRRAYWLWFAAVAVSVAVGLLLGWATGSLPLGLVVAGVGSALGAFQIWGTWMNCKAIGDESVRLHPGRLADLQLIIFPRLRYPEGAAAAARCLERARAEDETDRGRLA